MFLEDKLIAHRGIYDNKIIPENSLGSFIKAVQKGYIIEFDVHLTKDNKLVVFHDDNLKRMTNIDKKIKKLKLKELQNIKLLNTDYTIPSLDDVLKTIDGEVPILIELKYDVKGYKLPRKLYNSLKNYNGEVAVQSFDPFLISYFKIHKAKYLRGFLTTIYDNKFMNSNFFFKLSLLLSKPQFLSISKNLVNNKKILKQKNKKILIWTINSKDEINKYKNKENSLICNIYNCEGYLWKNI